MATGLSASAFEKLLAHLDADRARAGERYEDLRRILVRFFEWRGAPAADRLADETLDRVARRLTEGVEVKNIGAYCYSVARLVLLETRKSPLSRQTPADNVDLIAEVDRSHEDAEREQRLGCLDGCLGDLSADSRDLIVAYYREDKRARIDARRALAERLGVKAEALANRAQRLRDKLERCVNGCLSSKSAT